MRGSIAWTHETSPSAAEQELTFNLSVAMVSSMRRGKAVEEAWKKLAVKLGINAGELEAEIAENLEALDPGALAAAIRAGVRRTLILGLQAEYMARTILRELGGKNYSLQEISWVEGFEGIALSLSRAEGDRRLEIYLQKDGLYIVHITRVSEEAGEKLANILEQAIINADKGSGKVRRLVEEVSTVKGAELSIEPEVEDNVSLAITVHVDSLSNAPKLSLVEEAAEEILRNAENLLEG